MIERQVFKKVVHKTEAGKTLQLTVNPNSNNLIFQWQEGGEIPATLSGIFTDERQAFIALNNYLNGKPNPSLTKASEDKGFIEGILSN